MNKIFNIVKFNVNKNIKNKWFVVLNILFFATMLIAINFSTVKEILNENNISFDEKVKITIKDDTNILYETLKEDLTKIENTEVTREYEEKEYTKDNVSKEDIIVLLKENTENSNESIKDISVTVISNEGVNSNYIDIIQNDIKNLRKNEFFEKYGVNQEEYEKINNTPDINRIMLGVESSNADKKYTLQSICNYVIFFILLMILSKIANDISVEKVNKSIEYVLTSVEAKDYLVAKILSIIFTFVIQVIFTCMYLFVSMLINSYLNLSLVNQKIDLSTGINGVSSFNGILDANFVLYLGLALVFLILTIFLLSIIQAIFSSKTNNINEASNAAILLITLNVVIYIISTFLVSPLKAASIFTYIFSCIPIISMYLVPTMVILGQAKIWQIIISFLLLVITNIVVLKYGAIAFKNGVLDYTKIKKDKSNEKDVLVKEKEKLLKYEYSKIGYVIGFSAILFVFSQLILSYVSKFILAAIGGNNLIIEKIIEMIVFILSLLIPSAFVMAHTEKKKDDEKKNKQKDFNNLKDIIKCVVIALPIVFIVQIVVGIILEKLGLNYDIIDKVDMFKDKSILGKILFFVEIAVLPAIFEELYIRKAVLNFAKKYGTKFAIIASSLLFSVIHFNLSQMLFAFIMGIVLSVIAIKTKSIVASGTVHLLNNGYAALILIFEKNIYLVGIINLIYLSVIIIGIIIAISEIIKKKGKVKILEETKEDAMAKELKGIKRYRYIFYDYTFIFSVIMCIVMLLITEKAISLL